MTIREQVILGRTPKKTEKEGTEDDGNDGMLRSEYSFASSS